MQYAQAVTAHEQGCHRTLALAALSRYRTTSERRQPTIPPFLPRGLVCHGS